MGKVISTPSQPISLTDSIPSKAMQEAIITIMEKHQSFPPSFSDNEDCLSTKGVPISFTIPIPIHSDRPSTFILPDLVSHCKFALTYHVNGDEIAKQSVDWLDFGCPDLNVKQRKALRGLQAGELTAFCYNTCPSERLRVVSDFMNYLFHL